MNAGKAKRVAIVLAHAFSGWALCAATMGAGLALTTESNAVMIHAAAAPIIYIVVSAIYFKKFAYTSAIVTACVFTGLVILIDLLVVASIILGSFAMFESLLGTWIPFVSIFVTTFVLGKVYLPQRH